MSTIDGFKKFNIRFTINVWSDDLEEWLTDYDFEVIESDSADSAVHLLLERLQGMDLTIHSVDEEV